MHWLIAPDSLKDSLSSEELCKIAKQVIQVSQAESFQTSPPYPNSFIDSHTLWQRHMLGWATTRMIHSQDT